jgi:hypothetical protein
MHTQLWGTTGQFNWQRKIYKIIKGKIYRSKIQVDTAKFILLDNFNHIKSYVTEIFVDFENKLNFEEKESQRLTTMHQLYLGKIKSFR